MSGSTPQRTYVLRIYSGPHNGAEIQLTPGEYLLGRSEHCDVILDDDAIAPRHATLIVAEDQLRLIPLAQPVRIEQAVVPGDGATLQRLQLMTLGETALRLGLPDDDWAVFDAKVPVLAAAVPSDRTTDSDNPNQAASVDSAPTSTPTTPTKRRPNRMYPAAAATLLLGCVLVVVSQSNTKAMPVALGKPAELERVQQIVAGLKLPRLTVSTSDSGRLQVTGFVDNSLQRQRLKKALTGFTPSIRQSVWSTEDTIASTLGILRSLRLTELVASMKTPGKLEISGYVERREVWEDALAMLKRDLGGVNTFDTSGVQTLNDRLQVLRQLLATNTLGDRVQVSVDNSVLNIHGALDDTELKRFSAVQSEFRQRYGGTPKLRALINQAPELKLAIRGVSVGATPYLITKDGNKYMEGSQIDNGYVISAIKPDRIILARDQTETVYYLGGK